VPEIDETCHMISTTLNLFPVTTLMIRIVIAILPFWRAFQWEMERRALAFLATTRVANKDDRFSMPGQSDEDLRCCGDPTLLCFGARQSESSRIAPR
jgi:hypothetical protein